MNPFKTKYYEWTGNGIAYYRKRWWADCKEARENGEWVDLYSGPNDKQVREISKEHLELLMTYRDI